MLGQPRQPTADLDGHRAADPGVHLVEDERPAARAGGQHDLEGQPDPGQLARRRRPCQRAGLLPGLAVNSSVDWSGRAGRVRAGQLERSRACGMASWVSSACTSKLSSPAAATRLSLI